MTIYPGAKAVIQGGAKLSTSQRFADASARKAQEVRRTKEAGLDTQEQVDEVVRTIEDSDLAVDDGIPPNAPANLTATPFFHQVDLAWDTPADDEAVVSSLIRYREADADQPSRTVERQTNPAAIRGLPNAVHTFEVALVDRWGRESLWSAPVEATPMLTAAEEIDLGELAMLGRIQGLLPEANLSTITDATRLADELISSGKIAPGAVTGPKLPDSVISGPKLQAGAVEADKIAANAVVTEKLATDAIQTRHITAGAVTASVMAVQDAAAFNLWAQDAMIRSAAIQNLVADKITGGAFSAGTIDIVTGGSLKAGGVLLDSNGARFPAAHIKSASIDTLVADKITGGFFSAGTFNVIAGGAVVAGGARMDSTGFTVPSMPTFSLSSDTRENKVGTRSNRASLYFIENDDVNGAILQGDTTGGRRGYVGIYAITESANWTDVKNAFVRMGAYDNDTANRSYVEMRGGSAAIYGIEHTEIRSSQRVALTGQNIFFNGTMEPLFAGNPGTVAANGGWIEWTHNFGIYPTLTCAFRHMGNGQYRPLSGVVGASGIYIDFVSASRVRITNNTSVDVTVSCQVFK